LSIRKELASVAERLIVIERTGFGLATVMARNGVPAKRIGAALGLDAPEGSAWAEGSGSMLIGVGPGNWIAKVENASPFWADALRERLAGIASVSDQSSGYTIIRLTGADARTVLQRGVPIDLHPSAFAPGSVAVTGIAHIATILWQLDDAPTFDVAVFRSFAGSFRHWFEATIAAL
jgi:sarcosine oxidase subunit gamma